MYTACYYAARGGNIQMIEYLISTGHHKTLILEGAAEKGHLGVVQWGRKEGFPWSKIVSSMAASSGNLQLVQWIHSNGCEWGAMTCYEAIK